MARDVGDAIGAALGHAAREVAQTVSANAHKAATTKKPLSGGLSGGKGMAAGAGLVALVPLAAKGATKLARGASNGSGPLQLAGDKVTSKVSGTMSDAVGKSVEKAGGPGGLVKEAGKAMLPGGGGKSAGVDGVGKGRRMPIQQSVDVAVPVKAVGEAWTDYEEWPKFMHRVDRVSQEDDEHLSFKTKIWGISREFKAEIIENEPNERIKWRVTDGVSHTGVVSFHELAPRLTRIEVNIDVHPGSMIEKLGRGLRHAKRAVRADLHRFKAYVEMDADADDDGQDEKEQSSSSGSRRSAAASRGSSSRSASSGGRASSGRSSSGRSSSGRSSSGGGSSSGRSSSGKTSGGKSSSGGTSRRGTTAKKTSSSGSRGGSSSNGAGASSSKGSSSSRSRTSRGSSSNGASASRAGTRKKSASSS